MAERIKVRKSLGKVNILVKIERNRNILKQIPTHSELTDLPHTITVYTAVVDDVSANYTLHLRGDKEATIAMHEKEKIMDSYYYDTAAYVEIIANKNNDPCLPVSVGFEVYAAAKPRTKKGLAARDGNHQGEIFVSYPKLEEAVAYRCEMAEVIGSQDPKFDHAGACGTTFMAIQNVKPDTKFLVRICGIFAAEEGPFSDAIPFRTKEW